MQKQQQEKQAFINLYKEQEKLNVEQRAELNQLNKEMDEMNVSADKLTTELKKQVNTVDTLSMGMSNDYILAIEHGSNLVRIGTAIFGAREIKIKGSDN